MSQLTNLSIINHFEFAFALDQTIWRLYIPVYGSLVVFIAVYSVAAVYYESFWTLIAITSNIAVDEYPLDKTTELSMYMYLYPLQKL